jgi:hypothetical protein
MKFFGNQSQMACQFDLLQNPIYCVLKSLQVRSLKRGVIAIEMGLHVRTYRNALCLGIDSLAAVGGVLTLLYSFFFSSGRQRCPRTLIKNGIRRARRMECVFVFVRAQVRSPKGPRAGLRAFSCSTNGLTHSRARLFSLSLLSLALKMQFKTRANRFKDEEPTHGEGLRNFEQKRRLIR